MNILLPLCYIFSGVLVGRFLPSLKSSLAKFLTKICIPYVIAYNLLTYNVETILLAGFGVIFCILLFITGRIIWKDRLIAISLSYLNIGWLGLPLAIAIFGDTASRIIIAVYVGSSIFGNVASVAILQPHTNWQTIIRRTLASPPVLAVLAGTLLRFSPIDLMASDIVRIGYDMAKQLMSITGMCILGIWLYGSHITLNSIHRAVPIALCRAAIGTAIVLAFIEVCHIYGIYLITTNPAVLFILPLLPPAANIVVLETYYRGTGQSAQAIASGTLIAIALLSFYAGIEVLVN